MSFNNQIFGSVPSSPAMIYTSSNMSSDNISCTNLSGSIATFDQLSVVTFNPISFSATYADITNLSCDNLSCQFKSTFGSISTGNISITGDLTASNVSADNISATTITSLSNISTPNLYVDNTFFYGSTGSIVSSLVTMSTQMLYQLGNLDYKIRSVTDGIEYMTSDSTLGNTNISNLSADNVSMQNVSVTTYMTAQQLSVLNNLNVSNNLYVYGDGGAVGRVRVGAMDFKSSATNFKLADMDITEHQIDWNFKKDMYFYKDDTSGQSLMTFKHSRGNVNISNCSIDNLSSKATSVEQIEYRHNSAGVKSYVSVNTGAVRQYHYSSWEFRKDDDAGIVFMKIDYAAENINISNLSCANISTNLLNNISAGDRISLSTEAGTNKLVITASGELNSSNLSLDNLSVENVSVTTYMTAQQLSVLNNLNVSNNLYVYGDGGAVGRVRVGAMDFKSSATNFKLADMDITEHQIDWNFKKDMYFYKDDTSGQSLMTFKHSRGNVNISNCSIDNLSSKATSVEQIEYRHNSAGVKSYVSVNTGAVRQYHYSSWEFRKDDDAGIVFMKIDYAAENINISNLSVSNLNVEFVDLTNNLSDGKGINITSSGGKAVISLQDPVNISTITTENMNVSGSAANFFDGANIYGTATVTNLVSDLTNTLSAGSNITITSVGGKAQISSTGGGGGTVPANLSIDNLSVNFDATIGGDLKMLSADIIATSSELFIQDVTCTGNMSVSSAFGANTIAASSTLTVGTNATVTGNITASVGDITATTGTVFAPNVSGTKVTGNNLSVFNDATITRDLKVQRYLDSGKPSFILCIRTGNLALSGVSFLATYNLASTAQQNGQFSFTNGGSGIEVTTGGWYRVSWSFGFLRTANTGGDRAQVRAYSQTRTASGGYAFNSSKNTISSSCYLRRNNQCREGHITGYNFVYIEAGGGVNILIQAMVEASTSWSSDLSGISLRASSNLMVEFVSSAAET